MTQQRSHFFLDVDDDVRLTQIFGQAGVLSAKFLDFFFHGVALGLRPAFLWGQSLEDSLGPLSLSVFRRKGSRFFKTFPPSFRLTGARLVCPKRRADV